MTTQQLLQAGLMDTRTTTRTPVFLGSDIPLLHAAPSGQRLRLIEVHASGIGFGQEC